MNRPSNNAQDITEMLREWSEGKREALDQLLPLVYDELHRQASYYLRRERRDHTLQATALINEAYLKLIDQRDAKWQSRAHFFAISAQIMRRILVDYARAVQSEKRGGDAEKIPLEEITLLATDEEDSLEIIALDTALEQLAAMDQQQARVVELRYFSGLSLEETAEVLGVSRTTVARDWSMAKAWLYRQLKK